MMEAWFLQQWQRNSPWQILLRPLSWAFALLVLMRRSLYRAGLLQCQRVGVPVIVVGNISVGGTGKTPVVLALAQILARSGRHCGIISRGYARGNAQDELRRGTAKVIHVVPVSAEAVVLSDEATLLAERSGVPVYISADRPAAARALLQHHPEVDVLICDDGLQHYALARDLEICLIDGSHGIGNGALMPAGPLREAKARLRQVDAIVINGGMTAEPASVAGATRKVPVYGMELGNESLIRVRDNRTISIEEGLAEFKTKRILALAGTGNPQRFFVHLASLGFKTAYNRLFPDHHSFAQADFSQGAAEIILMTEKDAVKCKTFADDRMWFMRVDAILPEAFGEFVVKRLSEMKNNHVPRSQIA